MYRVWDAVRRALAVAVAVGVAAVIIAMGAWQQGHVHPCPGVGYAVSAPC